MNKFALFMADGFTEAEAKMFAEANVSLSAAHKLNGLGPVMQATIAKFNIEEEFETANAELEAHKAKKALFNRLDDLWWDMVETDKNMFLVPAYQDLHNQLDAYNAELNDKHLGVGRRHELRQNSTDLHSRIQAIRRDVMGEIRLDLAIALKECEDKLVLDAAPKAQLAKIKLAEIRQYQEYKDLEESA